MFPRAFLPDASLEIEAAEIEVGTGRIRVRVRNIEGEAVCPCCGKRAKRIHSGYERQLHDVPCGGFAVEIVLNVRRFFCDAADCRRKTFAERMPTVTKPYARRTNRLDAVVQCLGLLLGSRMGKRVLEAFQVSISIWSLLRSLRGMTLAKCPSPRILGMDDWAMRRGRRYGTMLVNLETNRVVDLLPDREAQTVADWLRAHPGVEVISRDRAECYAEGARQGAPDAVQVADRWHLLKNLGDMLIRVLSTHRRELNRLAQTLGTTPAQIQEKTDKLSAVQSTSARPQPSRRAERFRQVHALHTQGLTISAISRQIGLDRKTVRKYLEQTELPPVIHPGRCVPHYRSKKLAPYEPYLLEHWEYGRRTVRQMYCDLQLQGYTGCLTAVADFLSYIRKTRGLPAFVSTDLLSPGIAFPYARLSPRTAAWLALAEPETLTDHERTLANALPTLHQEIQLAVQAAQRFAHLVRTHAADQLDVWLTQMCHSSLPQLRSFARSLQQDYSAVRAALTLPWSNGPVEGHVNRLKFIKRQMFGRAKFDLLRLRVLASSP